MKSIRLGALRLAQDRPFQYALALAVAFAAIGPAAAQQRRPITEMDLFKFVWVADPQIAPDGNSIVFVRVTVDEKKDQYDTSLWIARTDGSEPPRPLTGGTRDSSPRWSPDGRSLAFVRVVDKDNRPQPPQIYVLAMAGGEARQITDLPRGAGNPEWAPDNRTLAFGSGTKPDEVGAKPADQKAEPPKRESDVRVITEAVYRANGVGGFGYVDRDRPSQVWTVTLSQDATIPKPKRLTSGTYAAGNFQWSGDGSRVYFVANTMKEPYYEAADSDLYAVSKDGGDPVRVLSIDGTIGAYAESPDGKRIAFIGSLTGKPERSYSQPDLWVADISGGTPRNLTESFDFDANGSVGGDQRAPRGGHPAEPIWSKDGRTILIKVGHQGNAALASFDVSTGKQNYGGHFKAANEEIMLYTADRDADTFAAVVSTPTVVGDLYVVEGTTGATPKKLTSFNDELFNQLTMNEPEEIWYRASTAGKSRAGS